jgi:signal transduction histidine kinase
MAIKKSRYVSKKFLIILFVLSMVLLLGLSMASIIFRVFLTRTMEHNIQYRLLAVSKMASQLTTLDELNKYRTVEDMELPSYNALRLKLRDFSRDYDVLYVYYIRRSGENQLQYIVDNDFNEETRVGLNTPPYNIQPVPWIKLALEGKASHSGLGNYTPGWEGLLTTYTPLFDEDGNVGAIAGVDILDRFIVFARLMIALLNVLQIVIMVIVFVSGFMSLLYYRIEAQKASDASAAKSVFLSNMSHEFRTPLNAVLGMGELIRMTDNISLIQNYTDEIMAAGQDLLCMVDELIEYSNSGKKSSENKPDSEKKYRQI